MKTIGTYKISLIVDTEKEIIKEGYKRLIQEGETVEQIEKRLVDETLLGLKGLMDSESEDGMTFVVEKLEDL